jgi:hypothetical protein
MPRVVLDPDGTARSYLGLVVLHPTGVVYEQQCGGTEAQTRSAEGYFVPLGGVAYDPGQRPVTIEDLTAVFHHRGGCAYGGEATSGRPELPPQRLDKLRALVETIPYWTFRSDGETDARGRLRLDEGKTMELMESWVPVMTPDGAGVLTWPNCD